MTSHVVIIRSANIDFNERMEIKRAEEEKRFRMIDADGSGELDLDELRAGASILGITEDEAEALFREMDTDGGGTINMDE